MAPTEHSEEVVLTVDLTTQRATSVREITLQSLGLRERSDFQRWVSTHPEIVGPGLLLVTTEFDRWEVRERRVDDRLDVLFIDADASPVVAELKRDRASDTTELQALKYAAYCAQLTADDLIEEYARFHNVDDEQAQQTLLEHAPALADGEVGPIRVRLVAGSFGPAVTSVVLWLRDHGIDIGCVQVIARQDTPDRALLLARQLIPLPEAEDYLVRRRRKEQVEEVRKTTQRRAETSVALLRRTGRVSPGDVLELKLDQFTREVQPLVETLLADNPDARYAEWADGAKPLLWRQDGQRYTPTGLVKTILAKVGKPVGNAPGPDYWLLPSGRSMYEESKLAETSLERPIVDGSE